MNHRRYWPVFVLAFLTADAAVAQEAPMERFPDLVAVRVVSEPLRLAEVKNLAALAELAPVAQAEPNKIDEMLAWNAAGNRPVRIGYERSLPQAFSVQLASGDRSQSTTTPVPGEIRAIAGNGNLRWGVRLLVKEAKEVRVFLDDVVVPPGTTFWVWAAGQEPRAFDITLQGPDGSILAPTADGEEVFLEADLPSASLAGGSAYGFRLARVVEVPRLSPGMTAQLAPGDCLIDATCITASTLPVVEEYRAAVGQLLFLTGGGYAICTGGLINDTDPTTWIPYLLTANHCFTTQAEASTLEIAWDYKTATCGGAFPSIVRTNPGAALLATSAVSDFTFLRLNSVPAGRVALGWNANTSAVPAGTVLHRISHPKPDGFSVPGSQAYSQTQVETLQGTCDTKPRPQFVYAWPVYGAVYGGSSGGPVILANGQVVGQLFGQCGPAPSDGCDYRNRVVDGAFSTTYSSIAQWLNPPPPQTLTVTKAGTGSGTVTSSPAGINCGATCSAPFASGAVVVLSAAATAGSTFSGWSGEGCSGTGNCTVTMSQARNVTATFTLSSNPILTIAKAGTGSGTVTSSPVGINCGATCSVSFTSGTVVTLSAAATAGSIFAGWSGEGCSGTGTCVVTMSQARNVTATFNLSGGGGGCTPGTTTLCVDGAVNGDKRFKIEVDWSTIQGGGQGGKGTAVATAPIGFAKGGIFWFFDSTNPEMLVKVINGCGVNGKFWVFASAGTNVGLNVKVTDTQTGILNSYVNPDLTAALPVQDVVAFSCN